MLGPLCALLPVDGWKVEKSEYPNIFEVHFLIEGDDRDRVEHCVEEVEKVAIYLSLKNKQGFFVENYSPGTVYKGQAISFKSGFVERNAVGINIDEIDDLNRIISSEECLNIANALRSFYTELTDTTRIALGWAVIEGIFDKDIEELFTSTEIDQVKSSLIESGIDETKVGKLVELIRNKIRMPRMGRNERIAGSISLALGWEYQEVLGSIRKLSKARGKKLHTLDYSKRANRENLRFIESILLALLKARGCCDKEISPYA